MMVVTTCMLINLHSQTHPKKEGSGGQALFKFYTPTWLLNQFLIISQGVKECIFKFIGGNASLPTGYGKSMIWSTAKNI